MQDCFREHPDIYGAEIDDDDDLDEDLDADAGSTEPRSPSMATTSTATPKLGADSGRLQADEASVPVSPVTKVPDSSKTESVTKGIKNVPPNVKSEDVTNDTKDEKKGK